MKGIAAMKYPAKPEGSAKAETSKPKPSGGAKSKALKEVVSAIKDGDDDGAAKALEVAVKACIAEYKG